MIVVGPPVLEVEREDAREGVVGVGGEHGGAERALLNGQGGGVRGGGHGVACNCKRTVRMVREKRRAVHVGSPSGLDPCFRFPLALALVTPRARDFLCRGEGFFIRGNNSPAAANYPGVPRGGIFLARMRARSSAASCSSEVGAGCAFRQAMEAGWSGRLAHCRSIMAM